MSELPPDEPSIAAAGADPGTRKAAAYDVDSGEAAAAGAQTANQNSALVEHYSEPSPSQNREVARAATCNAAGAP